MFVTKQLSTFPAIYASIGRRKPLPTRWLRASVVDSMSLPMGAGYDLVWIGWYDVRSGSSGSKIWRLRSIFGIKYIQAFEFLVENGQRLEPFGLDHLCLEPVLSFDLFDLLKVLVSIVQMSVEL